MDKANQDDKSENEISMSDFESHVGDAMDRVAAGGSYRIVRNGRVVARLVPAVDEAVVQRRLKRIEEWEKISERLTLGGLNVREMIDEGRM